MQGPDFSNVGKTSPDVSLNFNSNNFSKNPQKKENFPHSNEIRSVFDNSLNTSGNSLTAELPKNGTFAVSDVIGDTHKINQTALTTLHEEKGLNSIALESKFNPPRTNIDIFPKDADESKTTTSSEEETKTGGNVSPHSASAYNLDDDEDLDSYESDDDYSEEIESPTIESDQKDSNKSNITTSSEEETKTGGNVSPHRASAYNLDDDEDLDSYESDDEYSDEIESPRDELSQIVDSKENAVQTPVKVDEPENTILRSFDEKVGNKETIPESSSKITPMPSQFSKSVVKKNPDIRELLAKFNLDEKSIKNALAGNKFNCINTKENTCSNNISELTNSDALIIENIIIHLPGCKNDIIKNWSVISQHTGGNIEDYQFHEIDEGSWKKLTTYIIDTHQALQQFAQMNKKEDHKEKTASIDIRDTKMKPIQEEKKKPVRKKNNDSSKTTNSDDPNKVLNDKQLIAEKASESKMQAAKVKRKHIRISDENRRRLEDENKDDDIKKQGG